MRLTRRFGAVFVAAVVFAGGCGRSSTDGGPASVTLDDSTYQIAGPYAHENLSVFLLCSSQQDKREFITLDEGLKDKLVKVSEKADAQVNQLVIENTSDRPLFLQEGDRLEGGKQDRIIIASLVVPPKSGQMPLPTNCIEQGRWTEGQRDFAGTHNTALAPKDVRNAAKINKNQSEVWHEVAQQRAQAERLLAATGSPDGGRAGGSAGVAAAQTGTAAPAEPAGQTFALASPFDSSLNTALDAPAIKKVSDDFAKALSEALKKHPDAVGVAIIVNGQIEEVNIYPNHKLLGKQYPRLLQSYAFQAAAQKDKATDAKPVSRGDLVKFMTEGKEEKKTTENVNADNRLQIRMVSGEKPTDCPKAACVTEYQGTAVHKQIVTQPAPSARPQATPPGAQRAEPNSAPVQQAVPAPSPPSLPK